MKNIGSKQAELLARKRLGPKAYAKRCGKAFDIGRKYVSIGCVQVDLLAGTGKSWAEALSRAGIEVPNETNCANVPTPADIEKLAGGGE
jgi:Tfp pilus assembly protein PilV